MDKKILDEMISTIVEIERTGDLEDGNRNELKGLISKLEDLKGKEKVSAHDGLKYWGKCLFLLLKSAPELIDSFKELF